MRIVAGIVCVLSCTSFGLGQDLRFIEFRDGSVMRLPLVDESWQITIIRPNGRLEQSTIKSAQLDNVTFTRDTGFARKQALLAAVRRLGAEDFLDREQAQTELSRLGGDARADLEDCLSFTTDPEARLRLQGILKSMPSDSTARRSGAVFDRFRLQEDCWGHLGDAGVAVQLDGKTQRLPREAVSRVSRTPPPWLWIKDLRPSAAPFERIAAADFPAGCIEEPFERTATGKPLEIGSNVERAFIDKGFLLSTSFANSFVSVNNFRIEGKSGGLSMANHQPIWEGTITVRFVEPGREQAPAGVHFFGCWIAAVVPNGTSMVAYDRAGHELGRITTQTHGNDFLGIRSATPMSRIQIVPNPQFDRDFTLDDFIFSPPINPESRHGDKFVVHTKNGSRFLCSDVAFEGTGVRLFGLPGELPDVMLPLNDFERIATPGTVNELPPSVFVELRDGSVLAGKLDGKRPNFTRMPEILKDEKQVRAIWSSAGPRRPPASTEKTQVWKNEQNRWQEITEVRFLDDIVLWKEDGDFQSAPYQKLPILVFADMPERSMTGWRILTEDGDELTASPAQPIRGRLSEGLTFTWHDRTISLRRGEVRFLLR